jgi:curved DNA-binding protein CbpA
MHYFEATAVLGLTLAESWDESKIKRSWKQMVKTTHPDKNISGNANATLKTQRLNEAKDILINRLTNNDDKKRREDDEEKVTREKELAETEAKQEAERQMKLEQRRERYAKNRRKRSPSARVHKTLTDYKEGKELANEIKNFFRENFKLEASNKLAVKDVLDLFVKSRYLTTRLEINLFKRHSKRIFLETWPSSIYSMCKNKRCFLHVTSKSF